MPDVNITINTPTLTAGKTFKVRYRLLPAGAWSSYQTETNATFTLTGLADGYYELEAIIVNADSSECPPTYKKFQVVTPFACITFTAEIVQSGSLYYMEISYTPPSGNPACGWIIVCNGNVVNYPSLPTPPLKIQTLNKNQHLQIIANNCNGNQRACFSEEIPEIVPEPCVPVVLGTVTAAFNHVNGNGKYVFDITIPITQSVPCTNWFTLLCTQQNVPSSVAGNVSFSNFTFGNIACTATSLTFQITAHPPQASGVKLFEFAGKLIDGCNVMHDFEVEVEHD